MLRRRRGVFVAIPVLFLTSIVLSYAFVYEPFVGPGQSYLFGVIGNDTTHLQEEREAGVEAKLFYLSWREYYPQEGIEDEAYIAAKKQELQELREAGFEIILLLGFQDTPTWVHQNYDNSYYIDQYGDRYVPTAYFDNGDANLVFNQELRGLVASYMQDVILEFGTDFYAVRLGGGRYGELTYPPTHWNGKATATGPTIRTPRGLAGAGLDSREPLPRRRGREVRRLVPRRLGRLPRLADLCAQGHGLRRGYHDALPFMGGEARADRGGRGDRPRRLNQCGEERGGAEGLRLRAAG